VSAKSLRTHRLEKLLSIRGLAERSGVTAKTILDLEHGRRRPRLETMRRLCEVLSVAPGDVTEFRTVLADGHQPLESA
jgi:transcriptional regulator with XRE-family HTH domain